MMTYTDTTPAPNRVPQVDIAFWLIKLMAVTMGETAADYLAVNLGLDAVLGFWLVYIFTRPLGASFGDFLSQPGDYGGLGLGTIITSVMFLPPSPPSSSS
jgi:uncharacterized membrane-anchored protein